MEKIINILRIGGNAFAFITFVIGGLYLAEYFGNPETVELLTIFKWFGYSAVLAIFSRIMEIAGEEISTERV